MEYSRVGKLCVAWHLAALIDASGELNKTGIEALGSACSNYTVSSEVRKIRSATAVTN